MTTEECVTEINEKMERNFHGTGERYAVLKPQENYDGVDWNKIANQFKEFQIHAYNQGNKIVISKL